MQPLWSAPSHSWQPDSFCVYGCAVMAHLSHRRGAEPGRLSAGDEEAETEGDAFQGAQAHRLHWGHVQQPAGGVQV